MGNNSNVEGFIDVVRFAWAVHLIYTQDQVAAREISLELDSRDLAPIYACLDAICSSNVFQFLLDKVLQTPSYQVHMKSNLQVIENFVCETSVFCTFNLHIRSIFIWFSFQKNPTYIHCSCHKIVTYKTSIVDYFLKILGTFIICLHWIFYGYILDLHAFKDFLDRYVSWLIFLIMVGILIVFINFLVVVCFDALRVFNKANVGDFDFLAVRLEV